MFSRNASHILRTCSSFRGCSRFNLKPNNSLVSSSWSSPRYLSTVKLIQELRKATGAPMLECKKAISAEGVDGDFTKATEWLRKNGSAKISSKVGGRNASEGLVGIAMNEECTEASIVRVSSETDFASRSADFSDLVETVAGAIVTMNNSDSGDVSIDELKTSSGVESAMENAILAIRENLQISSAYKMTASSPNSIVAGYVHGKVFQEMFAGTAAAIVELIPLDGSSKQKEEIQEIGKKIAMHIVAARPEYFKRDEVPSDVIEKEKDILLEQMADSGKPPEILEKIVNGRLNKFYEGVCLLDQGHMLEEDNTKISKVLKNHGLELVAYKSLSIQ